MRPSTLLVFALILISNFLSFNEENKKKKQKEIKRKKETEFDLRKHMYGIFEKEEIEEPEKKEVPREFDLKSQFKKITGYEDNIEEKLKEEVKHEVETSKEKVRENIRENLDRIQREHEVERPFAREEIKTSRNKSKKLKKKDILRGVIFSEILDKPKSLRR